jgi:molecular chaperone DnaK
MTKKTDAGVVTGIDLGTTNSVVAIYESDGKPRIVPNADGDALTPSVVNLRDEKHPVVGRAAVHQAAFAPEYTASLFKRSMGKRDTDGQPIPAFIHPDSGQAYTPEELSGMVIRYLVTGVEAALGEKVIGVVISVPAYFESDAREATKRAAELAGVRVLQIVNEPTAAALAFGLDGAPAGDYAVYDFGGGTFDITILGIEKEKFTARVTDGDCHCGGSDCDNLAAPKVTEAFQAEHGFEITPTSDLVAYREILEKVETAKKTLSQSDTASFVVSSQGQRLMMNFDRADFNVLIAPIVDRTKEITLRALSAAAIEVDGIRDVILVGGSTRIPTVREMLTEVFGKAPRTDGKPDEAVALGAAIYAARIAGDKDLAVVDTQGRKVLPPPTTVTDVTSHTLGCLALRNGAMRNCVIIPANTPLPAEMSDTFALVDDRQTVAEVRITSGPDGVQEPQCKVYGELRLEGLPPRPAGKDSIEVKYGYTVEGVLTVTITDTISKKGTSDVRRLNAGASGA